MKSRQIDRLIIATDNSEIASAAEDFGAEVAMTSSKPKTGSDRAAEVAMTLRTGIVVNIQADNFGLKSSLLDRVINTMKRSPAIKFATLARQIDRDQDLFDPGVVKLVMNKQQQAQWFSRYPIPYLQHATSRTRSKQFAFFEHIGVYFYRAAALASYASWGRSQLEMAESLEQLRILENGGTIKVYTTKTRSVSIDRPEDLRKLDRLYTGRKNV
jgi:3-deoxy-manno-octulosonate cytidylyltransferase (CMP-KDO synthetase)